MSVRILEGDCRTVLAGMPDGSINCCVTSPPYFGLRDYGVDGQIGLEETPDAFVAEMVAVFREVRRVLRDDGTLWLNLGDSYAGSWGAQGRQGETGQMASRSVSKVRGRSNMSAAQISAHPQRLSQTGSIKQPGLKPKDLIGIPWMVAFALRADGWYLRQDNIWHKPNPMPESVTDRCTKAHEYLFLLTKSQRYYFDAEAIAEERTSDEDSSTFRGGAYVGGAIDNGTMGKRAVPGNVKRPQAQRAAQLAEQHGLTDAHIAAIRSVGITDTGKARVTQDGTGKNDPAVQALADEAKAALGGYYREFLISTKRNKRSVWTVATQPFKEAHFATFPPKLIEPCIKAGCPAVGTVLDPFGGAGTTGLVADRLQRDAILIELNPAYADIARRRIAADAGLFGAVA
ncbi:site-specific DNA-methyltransferase [Mesorhizobium sp. B2-1-3A]|uniref:DNA-methyltransferase n=1 Tax=Mesorhizobium sp. B2-1-3A TaxID=2589971 RepID=UPI001128D95C|nr:site-specific DNA-methyltransferase [Mesorhizobium sp. B2-1-3A]TPM92706.1 site-specific DNA-methyltransferase [Mesorhizobium sp. B2-1-3A]